MQFGYHNHHVEFKKFDGKTGFDTLFAATDPDLVKIELDVGWAVAASQDPVAILNKYKGRVVALHVKDIGKLDADPHKATTVARGRRHHRLEEGHRHRERQWREALFLRAGRAVHPAHPGLGEDQRGLPHQARDLTRLFRGDVKTIKGPAVFLAQFAGGGPHLQNLNDMAKWAKECGFIGVQLPSWDGRVMDLQEGRREQDLLR